MAEKKGLMDAAVNRWSEAQERKSKVQLWEDMVYDPALWGDDVPSSPEDAGYHVVDETSAESGNETVQKEESNIGVDDISDDDVFLAEEPKPLKSNDQLSESVASSSDGSLTQSSDVSSASAEEVSNPVAVKEEKTFADTVGKDYQSSQEKRVLQKDIQKLRGMQTVTGNTGFDAVAARMQDESREVFVDEDGLLDADGTLPEPKIRPAEYMRKGLEKARQRKNSPGKVKKSAGAVLECKMSTIKEVPRPLLDAMLADFTYQPKNQSDVAIAWMYCHLPKEKMVDVAPYLSETQRDLVSSWEGGEEQVREKKLDNLRMRVQALQHAVDTLELLLSYLAYDRLGFRRMSPPKPEEVDFLEDGVLDVLIQAENQTSAMRYDRGIRKGRPKR